VADFGRRRRRDRLYRDREYSGRRKLAAVGWWRMTGERRENNRRELNLEGELFSDWQFVTSLLAGGRRVDSGWQKNSVGRAGRCTVLRMVVRWKIGEGIVEDFEERGRNLLEKWEWELRGTGSLDWVRGSRWNGRRSLGPISGLHRGYEYPPTRGRLSELSCHKCHALMN
jgi:hypothetical protein